MGKVLMKGNEVFAEAAIQAGCRYFFGYPITPQNEIPEYMSRRLPEVGGVYLQAESEVAAINMIFGAAATGARVMTSSSGPGISLMQEGISYIAGAELPCLIVNVMRAGPGLGGILPSQSDYFQATKGGGHGDYRLLVLAPSTLQEAADLIYVSFDLAEFYRNPVMVLADGFLGQMMESVEFRKVESGVTPPDPREWAVGYAKERGKRALIKSLYLNPEELERHNLKLKAKYDAMREREIRFEEYMLEDAELMLVAYGTCARIAKTAVKELRDKGVRVGLFRPISLFPFPYEQIYVWAERVRRIGVVEMSTGQMLEDVLCAAARRCPVEFYGRVGGMVPSVAEVVEFAARL